MLLLVVLVIFDIHASVYCVIQSLMQGLLICSEALARATAPVWGEYHVP